VDRPPVWLMRQAGRYLPEYQEVKGGRSFGDLIGDPRVAAEITMQPVRRFGMDAAIVFSDILVVPQALGMGVSYGEDGPVIERLVRGMGDVERLEAGTFEAVAETMRIVREGIGDRALVGFAGGPLTLAAYMVEGRISRDLAGLRTMAMRRPEVVEALLGRISEVVGDLLEVQIRAGADVVQVFDTWAGRLPPDEYERWALPWVRRVVERIKGSVPVILYVDGCAGILEAMAGSGADVLSLDARVRLSDARARIGRVALQGNLDPVRLLGPVEGVRAGVRAMIGETGGEGHVVNLGHGVLPPTPIESVRAFVEAVGP